MEIFKSDLAKTFLNLGHCNDKETPHGCDLQIKTRS